MRIYCYSCRRLRTWLCKAITPGRNITVSRLWTSWTAAVTQSWATAAFPLRSRLPRWWYPLPHPKLIGMLKGPQLSPHCISKPVNPQAAWITSSSYWHGPDLAGWAAAKSSTYFFKNNTLALNLQAIQTNATEKAVKIFGANQWPNANGNVDLT